MNLVQHYNLAVTGELLMSRVLQRMFSKILTFEVGWFDLDQNTSGVVCSRLAKEANVASILSQCFYIDRDCFFSINLGRRRING